MHSFQYIRHTLLYCLFAVFSCCNLSNSYAQEQYGFSKYFYYQGDTIRRYDQAFASLLYDSATETVIVPSASSTYQIHYVNEWRKFDLQGNTTQLAKDTLTNNRYYENIANTFAWEDNSTLFSAGGYFLQDDSFYTLFLQKMNHNMERIWFKSFPLTYNFLSVRALFPINDSVLIMIPNMERTAAFLPHLPPVNSFAGIMKLDTAGNVVWHKSVDSGQRNTVSHAIRAHDGNIMMCGTTTGYGITDNGGAWVMKVDTAGNKLWHKTYDLPGFDRLDKITTTTDGNYICVGGTALPPQIQDMPRGGGRILKIDEYGELIWDTVINDNPRGGSFRTVVPAANGDVVAFGSSSKYYAYDQYNYQVGSTREQEGWALRLNADGDVVWNRIFGHNALPHAHDYLYNAVALSDGGFVASGTTFAPDTFWNQGQQINAYKSAGWIVKLDENGCVDTTCSEILGTGIGSGPQIQYGLSLYPNPGKGKALLTTALPLPANTQLSITDIMGRTVWQTTVSTGTQQIPIDISRQPSGLYLIRLQADGRMYSLKYVMSDE